VRDFLTETFLTRTQAEWVQWMASKDVAFAPVKSLREGLDDVQTRHRAMLVEDRRGWEHLGIPIKFADEPGNIRFDPPAHGQHSEEICGGSATRMPSWPR
jgi:crotonobetainyl-CoA:carnitine CoA-transferase CaiB-like acyl-CoA transferase